MSTKRYTPHLLKTADQIVALYRTLNTQEKKDLQDLLMMGNRDDDEIFLTTKQVALVLNVSKSYVFQLRKTDELKPVFIGNSVRFKMSDIKKIGTGEKL